MDLNRDRTTAADKLLSIALSIDSDIQALLKAQHTADCSGRRRFDLRVHFLKLGVLTIFWPPYRRIGGAMGP